jgi:hypothetical protein
VIDPRRRAFTPYVRALADLMELRDWTVSVDDSAPDDGMMASVHCAYGRKNLTISLSDGFLDEPEGRQRQTVAHELVHAHLQPMHQMLHGELQSSAFAAYKLPMEYAVDAIAEGWARHLPLPSQVRPSERKDDPVCDNRKNVSYAAPKAPKAAPKPAPKHQPKKKGK